MGENTIYQIVKGGLCAGCGTCIALCSKEAIGMRIDERKGIYVPELHKDRCNNCGVCLKVCPGHEVDFKQLNSRILKEPDNILIGNYLNCYVGHALDFGIRYNSSSGGLVTQLLIFLLEKGIIDGALVTRMKKDSPLEPEPFIARTRKEIIEASKSKYCPVPANVALKEILDSKKEEKFAVVGLPCHIHGIRKAENANNRLKQKIILHLGLFCSTTKSFLATEFQLKRMKTQRKEVEKIQYRGEGWPGSMKVSLKSGQELLVPFFTYFDRKFCSFTPWRCTVCIDEVSMLSDISFGDAWLPEIKKIDNVGVSLVISRSQVGENFLQQMRREGIVKLEPIDVGKVGESQGGFLRGKYFKASLSVSKLLYLTRKLPSYNGLYFLPEPSLKQYLVTIFIYSKYFFIYRQNLWWILDLLYMPSNIINQLKNKLLRSGLRVS